MSALDDYVPPPYVAMHQAIRRLESDMPGREAEWVAEEALRRIKAADRRDILVRYVAEGIRAERRAEARRVERRAYIASTRESRVWNRKFEAERERIRVEDPTEYRKRWPTIGEAIDDMRSALRLELTAELLNSSFSLGDGRSVTWGRATVADHRLRAGLLATTAAGTLQTAALHEEAIAVIEAAGVTCLTEARMASVAA